MRKSVLRLAAVTVVFAVLAAGGAEAIKLRAGKLIVTGDGGFAPKTLPKRTNAPISLFFHGRVRMTDRSRPSPLRRLVMEFDKHGAVETRGLPVCTEWKLKFTTTRTARRHCPGAIVGKGVGSGMVEFPEQKRLRVSSPITIFNGPKKRGNHTVLAHAYLDEPVGPVTYIVPIEIQRVRHGRYGYRTVAKLPRIANDYGSGIYARLKIDRHWNFKGQRLSYLNAHCPDGRLQAKVELTFKDSTFLQGTALKPCKIRG